MHVENSRTGEVIAIPADIVRMFWSASEVRKPGDTCLVIVDRSGIETRVPHLPHDGLDAYGLHDAILAGGAVAEAVIEERPS
ncbi:MAG: hypothetical protein LCH99_30980 [Proteobacteria bacterium]|nr:hypothetical protein [Pseudomonadota bacterium]